jgi:Flp pilus assembly protein TadD
MQLDPNNAQIVCDYGYYCYLRQDLREAQRHFEHALQLDPKLKRAHNNLGLVYARTGRPDHALQQFTMAGLNPGDARANLGFVYLTEKRFPQAKAELQLAAASNPGSTKAQGILARFDRIQASANAEPAPAPPATAAAPAAQPPLRAQFDLEPAPAAEPVRIAAQTTEPIADATAHVGVQIPQPAPEIRRLAAETPRRAGPVETPRVVQAQPVVQAQAPPVAQAEVPRVAQTQVQRPTPVASTPVASNPPVALPQEMPASDRLLPTQNLAPVLSDYQF